MNPTRVLYLTAGSCYGPVPSDIRGLVSQLKGKRPSIWDQVPVHCSDVDDVWLWFFTYLCFLRKHFGCVVVDVQQEDLECSSAGCRGLLICTKCERAHTIDILQIFMGNLKCKNLHMGINIYYWNTIFHFETLYSQQRKLKYGVSSLAL